MRRTSAGDSVLQKAVGGALTGDGGRGDDRARAGEAGTGEVCVRGRTGECGMGDGSGKREGQ